MLNSNEGGGGCKKWSDEQKKQRSEKRRGFQRKIVLQYGLDGKFIREWESLSIISKTLDVDYNRLIKCCKLKPESRSVGGYQWRYGEAVANKVAQYDLDGNFIKEWNTSAEFLRSIGVNPLGNSAIACVCKGLTKTAYGYKWKYVTSETETNHPDIDIYYDPSKEVRKPILEYNLKGEFVREWECADDAANLHNVSVGKIRNIIHGRLPKYNKRGYDVKSQFIYKEGDYIPEKIKPQSGVYKIGQYDLEGNLIKIWNSTTEISKVLGFTQKSINAAMRGYAKTCRKFQWKSCMDFVPEKIQSLIKEKPPESTVKLLQYGMDGKFIKSWDYTAVASRELNISASSINDNIRGHLKSAGKFRWIYDDVRNITELPPLRVVCQYDMDGNLIREWNSGKEIVENTNYKQSPISNNLRGASSHAYGFLWKYK
jgi:hypothetical protein